MNVDIAHLASKILKRDIGGLARAITLNESTRYEDNQIIDTILQLHKDKLNQSIVISISGIPGVGKSSFIETLGLYLHSLGNSLAVFSIDPTSELTHGSILGDKTRMTELGKLNDVFIRPSPSSNRLGGLGINTHKNIELAKIAGFDIILVETVGVGQSETIVKNLCDIFVLLLMPASGDELQGIKKGIMEVADFYIIHKADGNLEQMANTAKKEIEHAIHLTKQEKNLSQCIFSFSSVNKIGLDIIWNAIFKEVEKRKNDFEFEKLRKNQRIYWLKQTFDEMLMKHYQSKHVQDLHQLEERVNKEEYISLEDIKKIFS